MQNEVETAKMSNKEADCRMVIKPVTSSAAAKSAQFCAGCGAKITGEASSCWRCGRFFQARESGTWSVQNSFYRLPAMRAYRSAAPTKRLLAALFDTMIVLSIIAVSELAAHALLISGWANQSQVFTSIIGITLLVPFIYFLAFDSTSLQGTPGKAFQDLKVTDLSDRTADFSSTFRRFISKSIFFLPTLVLLSVLLNAGIVMNSFFVLMVLVFTPLILYSFDVAMAFTCEDNRTLVDRLSGTMVVRR